MSERNGDAGIEVCAETIAEKPRYVEDPVKCTAEGMRGRYKVPEQVQRLGGFLKANEAFGCVLIQNVHRWGLLWACAMSRERERMQDEPCT